MSLKFLLFLSFLFTASCDSRGAGGSVDQKLNGARSRLGKLPKLKHPLDNPYSEKVSLLGEKIFFDPILSSDNSISCASCHNPKNSFSDTRRFSIGVDGKLGSRHAMPLANIAWGLSFFWDGRASSLEEQALAPVTNPLEMNESWPNVLNKLNSHPEYPSLFLEAFGVSVITKELVSKSIAQYERGLLSVNSKYQRYLRGEESLSVMETQGMNLFFSEKAECFHCHGGALLSDQGFHSNGLDLITLDLGLGGVTHKTVDMGKFKTPSLQNVAYRTHYMHDGRFTTLEQVVDHYNNGVKNSPNLDPLFQNGRTLDLTETEKKALVEFLKSFSDPSFK